MKKIEELKKEAGSENYKLLLKAAQLVKEMSGLSISVDKARHREVMKITEPMFKETYKKEKQLLRKVIVNIRKDANEKLNVGMDGKGTYFVD